MAPTARVDHAGTNPGRHYRKVARGDSLMKLGGFAATLKI